MDTLQKDYKIKICYPIIWHGSVQQRRGELSVLRRPNVQGQARARVCNSAMNFCLECQHSALIETGDWQEHKYPTDTIRKQSRLLPSLSCCTFQCVGTASAQRLDLILKVNVRKIGQWQKASPSYFIYTLTLLCTARIRPDFLSLFLPTVHPLRRPPSRGCWRREREGVSLFGVRASPLQSRWEGGGPVQQLPVTTFKRRSR